MVYAQDLKSCARKGLRVRVSPPAPGSKPAKIGHVNHIDKRISKYKSWLNYLLKSDSFIIRELHEDFLRKGSSHHSVEGVYIIFDKDAHPLYVGRTNTSTVLRRIGDQHVGGQSSSDLREMLGRPPIHEVLKFECKYIEVKARRERVSFEHLLILLIRPKLNN